MEMTITMRGRDEDIATLCEFLAHVQYLGSVGASRNLVLRVDGDGSGRMSFSTIDGEGLTSKTKYNLEQSAHAVVGVYDIG